MTQPHKHAAVIKAWADGKEIEFRSVGSNKWEGLLGHDPMWSVHTEYRVKPEPLEWQAERDAHARGEEIEASFDAGKTWWTVIGTHSFRSAGYQYRIKPKPHKWQKELDAHDRGQPVEFSQDGGKTWSRVGPRIRLEGCVDWTDQTLLRIPRKWQKEREAFERGERIQWRSTLAQHAGMAWLDVPARSSSRAAFDEPTNEFRIPHKWQAEMDAHERGETIQHRWRLAGEGFGPWFDLLPTGAPGWRWDHLDHEFRLKPKTVKTRIRVAAMGELELGRGWAQMVETEERAETIERSPRFLCWLHDWKEIERPVPEVPPGAYINGKAMSWVGIDHAAGPSQTGWYVFDHDTGKVRPVKG